MVTITKKAGVAILTSDKTDFKNGKRKQRQKWSLYNDKGSIHQKDTTIVSIYAPTIGALKYVKQNLTELTGIINHPDKESIRKQ